jgi:predicted ArsR family transcriptional regulator
MKLTRRQEDFVYNLLDLYRELQGPFHYTLLAERLGVSRFTAYDMLRLLEEKGLVTSIYQLAEGKSGPGRSEVFYKPTDKARRLMVELAGEIESQDWADIKARVLKKVQAGELQDRELAEQMLARVPPDEPKAMKIALKHPTPNTACFRNNLSTQSESIRWVCLRRSC